MITNIDKTYVMKLLQKGNNYLKLIPYLLLNYLIR